VARAGEQGRETEPAQQVVDGLQAAEHAELLLEDAADVPAARRAGAVGGGRAGLEALLLFGGDRALGAAACTAEQAVGASGVVAGDPGADLAGRQQDPGGDPLRGLPREGQADGGQAAGDGRPWRWSRSGCGRPVPRRCGAAGRTWVASFQAWLG
jgi:hypothetical protein